MVKLRRACGDAATHFEAYCRDDEAVVHAVGLLGLYDYHIRKSHPRLNEALDWAAGLEQRREVAQVVQRFLEP